MIVLFNAIIFFSFFILMEGVAWFTHKYIMHGFLWSLHHDHHLKEHPGFFERNDFFFLLFAIPGIILMSFGLTHSYSDFRFWMGAGITLYGAAYFFVHDIFIHQRFPVLKQLNSTYFRALRKAHKVHHKHLSKDEGECFGMLFIPRRYYEEAKKSKNELWG